MSPPSDVSAPRVGAGGLRELGPINWLLSRGISRSVGADDAHLFSTLGRQRGLFRGWLHFSAKLLFGTLSRHETELVILRVAHLRQCHYELDHHRRIGKRAGVDDALQARVFAGPEADGWTDRHRALLEVVDALVQTKDVDDEAWRRLASFYGEDQLLEIVLLVGQYDMLATTIGALRIARDF